jgi:hypothetical protein
MSYIKYLYVFLIGHFDLCRFPHDSYFEYKDSENIMLRIDTQNTKIHYESKNKLDNRVGCRRELYQTSMKIGLTTLAKT